MSCDIGDNMYILATSVVILYGHWVKDLIFWSLSLLVVNHQHFDHFGWPIFTTQLDARC